MPEEQEQLPLEDRKTILVPVPKEVSESERLEYETPYQRCLRIMKEGKDD